MRISGGEAKGRRLKVPPGARPASERVRLAVFASLGDAVGEANVLDLYCGSGAYGLEALSRGAKHATFVDDDAKAVETSRRNAERSGLGERADFRTSAVERYLGRPAAREGPFDLVFADPPYAADDSSRLIDAVAPLLAADGWLVLESRWSKAPVGPLSGLVQQTDRRYGDTRILMFRPEGTR